MTDLDVIHQRIGWAAANGDTATVAQLAGELAAEVQRLRAEADEWTVELPPAAAEVLRAARAWREARRDMPFGLKPEASALVAAVDAAYPPGDQT